VIEGLRGEGEEPTFVLFVVAAALFALQGVQRERLFNKPLQRAVQAAAKRIAAPLTDQALAQAAAIDRSIKGVGEGEPWQQFIRLGLKLADGSKA
jgi:DNA polymerase-3 subunit delta